MALERYLANEVALDFTDGIITRRDALRRLALMGLSASAAGALLAACAKQKDEGNPAIVGGPSSPAATTSTAAPAPRATSAGNAEAITVPGPSGTVQGVFGGTGTKGSVLVIHENRGLTDHIKSVAGRLVGDGYAALAVDLLSPEGGTDKVSDPPSALSAAPVERLVGDMKAGLDELDRRMPGKKLGVTGFCFGGGMVWQLLNAGDPRLEVAVPFYGPAPAAPDFSRTKAAVFAVYAEDDSFVNPTRDAAVAALEKRGGPHQEKTYAGTQHAFFNDTGPRYNAAAAAEAYSDLLAWFGKYLSA